MSKIYFSFFILFFSVLANAKNLPKYNVGDGMKYDLKLADSTAKMTLAVVESTKKKLVIETYFTVRESMMPLQMWQQFHMVFRNGKIDLSDAYMYMGMIKTPQRLPNEYLQGYDGVQMNSFLIGGQKDLDQMKVGVEKVSVPAGQVTATHYRKSENGQTIDFWISDEAKPFGIVKLKSSGSKLDHNYTLELTSIVKNVRRKINPKTAIPLNALGRSFLPKLGPSLFHK